MTVLDEDGDLELLIGEAESRFKVCAAAMRRASRVWKRMLSNDWAERRPTDGEPWVVALPDDYPEIMAILLALAHARFCFVPNSFDLHTIYELLIAVDRYETHELIRPYVNSWTRVLEDAHKSKVLTDKLNPIFATYSAYMLGNENLFMDGVLWLTRNIGINEAGSVSLLADGWVELNSVLHLGPQDLIGKKHPVLVDETGETY